MGAVNINGVTGGTQIMPGESGSLRDLLESQPGGGCFCVLQNRCPRDVLEPIVCADDAAAIDKAKRLVDKHGIKL